MKRRKKRKRVRTRDWTDKHEFAFSHDRPKHVRGETVPDSVLGKGFVPTTETPNATVVSHSGQWAFVNMGGEERFCLIDEKLIEGEASLLVPGDRVRVDEHDGEWFVRGIAERRNKISRLAGQHSRLVEQIIAVNVDILLIVTSAAKPRFKPGVVDRYLILAQRGGVEHVLCLNKMDLVDNEPSEVDHYRDLGLKVVNTSCTTDLGLEELACMLRGKLSVFAGQSGVGKSSLLKALDPELDIEVRDVSAATDKGRHATTASRLYELPGDIRVIDTPGIRKLGVPSVSADQLEAYFPEFRQYAPQCRFHNCTHLHEPDCAVINAVETADIPRLRYASYCRLRADLAEPSSGKKG